MADWAVYSGLFATAFAAATVLPLQSEAVLAGLLFMDTYPVAALVTVATIGNILGSVVNWMIGRGIERFRTRKWFPVDPARLDRATDWYQRYGRWSLLLNWLPVIGDPLTVVAGVLREPLWSFVAIVAVAKLSRYLVIAAVVLNWI